MNFTYYDNDNENRIMQQNQEYKPIHNVLTLLKEALYNERRDELLFDYLIAQAPSIEERNIIIKIRDDKRKYYSLFKQMYSEFSGEEIIIPTNISFMRPYSYIDGIKQTRFIELETIKNNRKILFGITNVEYRNIIFELVLDELMQLNQYNYILSLNLDRQIHNQGFYREQQIKDSFTDEEAEEIAKKIGIDFTKVKFDVEQFRIGLNFELEHGKVNPITNVTDNDPILTGKIALAHLNELPDYYSRLIKMEAEGRKYWSNR